MNLLKNERLIAIDNAGKNYLQTLDRQVANVKLAIYKTYALQDWSDLATSNGLVNDYQVLQEVIIAEERLRAIETTSEIVEVVNVHFPKWGRTVSTQGGLMEFDINEWNNIKMPLDSIGAQIVYYNDNVYLTSRYQLANPELFSVSARISFDKYHNLFSDNGITGTKVSTYLYDIYTEQLLLNKTVNMENEDILLEKIPTFDFTKDPYQTIKINGIKYVLINNSSSYSGLNIVNVVEEHELTIPFIFQKYLIFLFLFTITLIILLVFVYINRSIVTPINKMLKAFKPLEKGDFTVRLNANSNDEFNTLFTSFNHMVENLNSLVNEVYESELLVERANFKQLQSQISPHFLYNSFYALSTMIKIGDEENAQEFCSHLATYFQYITRSGADTVPLIEELKHAENYVNIMTMRNSNIEVVFHNGLKEEIANLQVPRLIIQPIIENSFEHGIKTASGRFMIKVSATQTENQIYISVEDNGKCSFDEIALLNTKLQQNQKVKETTGLLNIHKRLRIFFGSDNGILVSQSALGGLLVTICISVKGAPQDGL
jgi:two-component system sensor histidine kinase YesM